ncbi:NAD(P)-dependent oxidoreductase [Kitasatospora sp. NPDC002227]|uniref:NAD(P)-dependent oxidoreductase n=1 Tax=Kitasatospora sp. NPDC002227 TaxID=3154773 RepID=UPI00332B3B8B
MEISSIGFVGLGGMGQGMVGSLLRAGHRVVVWNRSPGPVATMVAQGAEPAADLAEVFRQSAVVSMLADDAAVEALLLDPALLAAAEASVHLNMATVSPELAVKAAELHAGHGIGYLAAPVLGRAEVAAAGQLNILAAGAPEHIDACAPLFEAMGRRTWRIGARPEQANIAKISANYVIACAIESLAEACCLAEAGGVRPADLVELLTGTVFPGPVYQGYGSMIAERRHEPAGFRLALGLKDVNLARSVGSAHQVPLPLGDVVRDALLEAVAHGEGDRDWSAVATVARRRAGLPD